MLGLRPFPQLVAQLAQRPVDPALDRRERLVALRFEVGDELKLALVSSALMESSAPKATGWNS